MKLKSDRKNYVIIALCAILLVMSIGYAAFSSLLTINGTASLSDSFCVGFDNTKTNTYTPTAGISGGTLPTGSMSYSGTACSTKYQPNSSLSATFKQPGDKIEYTLTIANKSTFTVAIESILVENQNVTSNTTITKGNIKYIVEMPLTTTLASNAETTMKVTAMFQNDTDVIGQYNGESQTLNVKINAEQGDSGFTPTPASFTGTIYRNNSYNSSIGDAVPYCIFGNQGGNRINSCESYNLSFSTESACNTYMQENSAVIENLGVTNASCDISGYKNPDELNKTYYLKHDIVNGIVTASYVCFVYNNQEQCMRGGDNGASFATNTQIIEDYQTYYNLSTISNPSFSNPGCVFNNSLSQCYHSGSYGLTAMTTGEVDVGIQRDTHCTILSSGASGCHTVQF